MTCDHLSLDHENVLWFIRSCDHNVMWLQIPLSKNNFVKLRSVLLDHLPLIIYSSMSLDSVHFLVWLGYIFNCCTIVVHCCYLLVSAMKCGYSYIAILGKPKSLRELVDIITRHDALYWEWQAEQKATWHFENRTNLYNPSNCATPSCPPQRPSPRPPSMNRPSEQRRMNPKEYTRWRDERLCYKCGKGGHVTRDCPTPWARAAHTNTPREEVTRQPKEWTNTPKPNDEDSEN